MPFVTLICISDMVQVNRLKMQCQLYIFLARYWKTNASVMTLYAAVMAIIRRSCIVIFLVLNQREQRERCCGGGCRVWPR